MASRLLLPSLLLCVLGATADAAAGEALAGRFALAQTDRAQDSRGNLEARRIRVVLQRRDGEQMQLSAAKLRIHNNAEFTMQGAVEIDGPEFALSAELLRIHMDEDEEYRLEIQGDPVYFFGRGRDRIEASRVLYDSRKREVVFPSGLLIEGDRGNVQAGPTMLNLDTDELISGGPELLEGMESPDTR